MFHNRAMPTLTEEMLLLLCDEDGVPLPVQQDVMGCALAGAVLMDLAFAGRIDTDLTALYVSDPLPTGNVMLDRVLGKIAARTGSPDAGTWVRLLADEDARDIYERALESLVARGVVGRRSAGPWWRLRFRVPHVIDAGRLRDARRRVADVLLSDDIPDPRDIALVSLADACGVLPDILGRRQFKQSRERVALLRRMDLVGREVAGAVAEIEHAILRAVRARSARFQRLLLVLSSVAGAAAAATLVAPRVPIPDRFGPGLLQRLWFDDVWQQWSGYALLALSVAGLATVMLAKLGKTARMHGNIGWRIAHAGFGIMCLALLFAHTGFRFGAHLNAVLMGCYLAALAFGALAGVSINGASALRQFGIPLRLRALPIRLHMLALIPLPALVIVHLLVVYLF